MSTSYGFLISTPEILILLFSLLLLIPLCNSSSGNASQSWFTSGRYLSSPESGQVNTAAYGLSPGSPRSSKNPGIHQETTADILDLVTSDQEFNYGNAKLANEISPGFHVTGNMDDLLALPKSQDWASNSGGQLIPQTVHFQSTHLLCWRNSPMAHMTQFDGSGMNTLELLDSDKKPYVMEDDTPEILKDSSKPQIGVKVSSPNKKRVSPPYRHLNEISSSSSRGGLKTGRKFILRAVPSFPPLTPCIQSKDVASLSTNNSQKDSSSK